MPYFCGGCKEEIKRLRVACPKCKNSFHQSCVGYKGPLTPPASKISADWLCPDCTIKIPRVGDNSSTPTRGSASDTNATNPLMSETNTETYIDSEIENEESSVNPDARSTVYLDEKVTSAIRLEIRNALKTEVSILIKGILKAELAPIRQDLNELKQSVDFNGNRQDEFEKSLNSLNLNVKTIDSTVNRIQPTILGLEERVNDLEQQLRESNLEFHGITEYNNEKLSNVILRVAETVSYPLSEPDIVHCTRVAKLNRESKQPRTVILKLKNRLSRDGFYSAVSRFNKAHPSEKLNTSHLGLAGERSPVYVSEHLSPANKRLHAATRIKCKEAQYKFVWVRNARIYVRKDESSPPIVIKHLSNLDSL
ncbi:uncharacterized protein LOC125228735 [Leguminivora glycinivorella]|uniref:uncharacterized protein LOC125228735 n=1 Tax=Leguminivora glycinivorella TaxID=1035111 RepID=UPI00200E7637|nr:uncharacterized protein LOC125228735 [Leguminivora glycinivorella]